jgi:hypothetical protein
MLPRFDRIFLLLIGFLTGVIGCLPWHWWDCLQDEENGGNQGYSHGSIGREYITKIDPSFPHFLLDKGIALSIELEHEK